MKQYQEFSNHTPAPKEPASILDEGQNLLAQRKQVQRIGSQENRGVYKRFKPVRREFIRYLAREYVSQLKQGGFEQNRIDYMEKHGVIPQQGVGESLWTVHHIIPRCVGGGSDFANLCLIQQSSHRVLHQSMDHQIDRMSVGEVKAVTLLRPGSPFYWQSAQTTKKQALTASPTLRGFPPRERDRTVIRPAIVSKFENLSPQPAGK